MTQLLGLREYARHRSVSHTAVRKAILAGRIAGALLPVAGGGYKIDRDAADRLWDANTDEAQQRDAPPPPSGPPVGVPTALDLFGQPIDPATPASAVDGTAPPPGSFAAYRAERERWNGEMTKLRYRTLARELVATSAVRDLFGRLSRSTRDALQGLGPVVAAEVSDPAERARVEARAREEVDRILSELARGLDE